MKNSGKVSGKLFQMDYDALIEASGSHLFCLSKRSWMMLMENTDAMHWTTRYRSIEGNVIDSDLVDAWAAQLERELMNWNGCCCGGAGQLTRWTAEGVLEISFDGGVTWQPYPEGDPRLNGNLFPPLPTATGTTTRCAAAQNIRENYEDQVAKFISDLSAGEALVVFVGELITTYAIYLGVVGVVGAIVTQLASALISLGDDAVSSAFTSDVYDRFECNVYCNTADDGMITEGGYVAIQAQINDDETGVTNLLLHYMTQVLGPVGLTNVGRTGSAEGEGCDDCDCGECADCTLEDAVYIETSSFLTGDLPEGWTETNVHSGTEARFYFVEGYENNIINFGETLCVVKIEYAQQVNTETPLAGSTIKAGTHEETFAGTGLMEVVIDPPQQIDHINWSMTLTGYPPGSSGMNAIKVYFCVTPE